MTVVYQSIIDPNKLEILITGIKHRTNLSFKEDIR